MKRSTFLRNSLLATGAVAMNPFPYHLFAGDKKKYATDLVELGNTGIKLTRLAMGTGTRGINGASNQTRKLGIKGLGDFLHYTYDNGIAFWDSADQYGTHPHLREALKHIPRENVVILTKTHATTEAEMKADLDRFRKEIGTDYLDIVLLHNMQKANWPTIKEGAMNILGQAREDGLIRAHGVSCHTIQALRKAAKTDWVQVDLARFNPAGVRMDADVATVRSVLQEMKQKGKAVIGMKILGAGSLHNRVDECLEFALAQEFMDCFTIGQESVEEFQDLVKRIPAASVRG
ncbi:MAG: aldo/keto reductase [Bacteroidota bacterium]